MKCRLAIALILCGGLVAFFALGGLRMLSLDYIQMHRDAILALTLRHYEASIVAAIVIYTGMTAFSIPGGAALSMMIGFLFGEQPARLRILKGESPFTVNCPKRAVSISTARGGNELR